MVIFHSYVTVYHRVTLTFRYRPHHSVHSCSIETKIAVKVRDVQWSFVALNTSQTRGHFDVFSMWTAHGGLATPFLVTVVHLLGGYPKPCGTRTGAPWRNGNQIRTSCCQQDLRVELPTFVFEPEAIPGAVHRGIDSDWCPNSWGFGETHHQTSHIGRWIPNLWVMFKWDISQPLRKSSPQKSPRTETIGVSLAPILLFSKPTWKRSVRRVKISMSVSAGTIWFVVLRYPSSENT